MEVSKIWVLLFLFCPIHSFETGIIFFSGYQEAGYLFMCNHLVPRLQRTNVRRDKKYLPPFYPLPLHHCHDQEEMFLKVFLTPTYNSDSRNFTSRMQLKSYPNGTYESNPDHWRCLNWNMIRKAYPNYSPYQNNYFELKWPQAVLFKKQADTNFYDEIGCSFQEFNTPCVCRWLEVRYRDVRTDQRRETWYQHKKPRLNNIKNLVLSFADESLSVADQSPSVFYCYITYIIIRTIIFIAVLVKFVWDEINKKIGIKQKETKLKTLRRKALKLQAINARKKDKLEEIKEMWIEEMIKDRKHRDILEKKRKEEKLKRKKEEERKRRIR